MRKLDALFVAASRVVCGVVVAGGVLVPCGRVFAQDAIPTPRPLTGDTDDRVFFDFRNRSVLVYGLYSAKNQGKRSGVDGEIFARREGKQILTDHLDALCKNSKFEEDWVSRLKSRKDWNPNFLTSQGSEIFPGSNLLIRLTAPFDKVFSKFPPNKINVIQNAEKENFVFKVSALPLSVLKCGVVGLKVAPGARVLVAPGYAVSPLPSGTTVIQLGTSRDGLEPATSADAAALKRSGFQGVQSETQPTFIPIESAKGF